MKRAQEGMTDHWIGNPFCFGSKLRDCEGSEANKELKPPASERVAPPQADAGGHKQAERESAQAACQTRRNAPVQRMSMQTAPGSVGTRTPRHIWTYTSWADAEAESGG